MMDEEKDLSSASLADEFADKDLQGLAGVIREMREASGLDKEANTREPVRHFNRLGRERAMQCLYQCEIAGSEDFVENNLRQRDLDGCPKVVLGRADEFFKRLAAQ